MTQEEAVALAATEWWKGKTAHEIVAIQLYEDRLIMPFGDFHKAVEEALGRSVWTHEFADSERLQAEFEGREDTPENPAQHALDSLAAMLVAAGKDPDETIIVVRETDG